MTKEEKIQELKKDFLSRDGENYTSAVRTGRLGWERSLKPGESYSSIIAAVNSTEELHKMAYNHARDMITAMGTPFRVRLSLHQSESFTDSKVVAVATKVLDDQSLTPGQRLDVFTGLAIHECCHLLYSDFSINPTNNVIAALNNIIEDERIERELGKEKPGFVNFIAATKYYYFGKYQDGMAQHQQNDYADLMNAILSIVRYPGTINTQSLEKFTDTLYEVRDILKKDFPGKSESDSLTTATKIYNVIKNYVKAEEEQKQKQQNGKDTGLPSDKDIENTIQNSLAGILKELDINIPQSSKDNEDIPENQKSDLVQKEGTTLEKILQGEIEKGKTKGVNVHKTEENKKQYLISLARVRKYIPAVANALRRNGEDRIREEKCLNSGKLDTGKLVEATLGVENIYSRISVSRADRICVCILIDESGSMRGQKIESARDTAVLLNEAIGTLRNVDLYVYGHTTSEGVKLKIYKEGYTSKKKYNIGSIRAEECNVDSLAIREAAARVRAKTNERCLFFVISDGQPCEAPENVKKAVTELSKNGFEFVSIGIQFDNTGLKMYDNHINMKDLSTMAPELGKVIKSSVMKKTVRR